VIQLNFSPSLSIDLLYCCYLQEKIPEQPKIMNLEVEDVLYQTNINLAKCLTENGNLASLNEALELANKALEINPHAVEPMLAHVRVYLSTPMYDCDKARSILSKVNSMKPTNPVIVTEMKECRKIIEERLAKDAELAATMLGLKL